MLITPLREPAHAPGESLRCSTAYEPTPRRAGRSEPGPHDAALCGKPCSAVNPGFVHTPLTHGATLVPGLVEEYIDNTPLGRADTPGDIAQTIGFLTSAAAGWMTGAAIDLNGGAHTKRYPDIVARIAEMARGSSAP